MSKEYTSYLKGVAILLMLFLHLFKDEGSDMQLSNMIYLGDTPLVYCLSRMCNPVPFFLILSGYGLYATYDKSGGVKPCKRASYLYLHLWIIYIIILPLACCTKPDLYPGTLSTFVKNVTSWQCSYIGEQWFFLPYIVLMVMSKWLFKLFDKLSGIVVLLSGMMIYGVTCYILKRYDLNVLESNMLFYNIFLSFHMLFPFILGYSARKYLWMEKMKQVLGVVPHKSIFVIGALICVCVVRCFISHSTVNPFYAISFVLLFSQLSITKGLGKILSFCGKHSMNIWLIHTWFCVSLFHDFFYSTLHYPIVMYISLLIISLVVSIIVELIYRPIKPYINKISV